MHAIVLLLLAAIPNAGLAERTDRAEIIARIGEADANHDGMATKGELIARRTANFTRFDRNADGALRNDDVPSFVRSTSIGSQFKTIKAQFDRNRNSKVTREEFVNGPTLLFDLADADRDNVLTKTEINAAAKGARQ
jgi:hypothetical protein